MLHGKKILIGITGSIAAYKAPLLVRLLIKRGADVKVVMTEGACDFVTPLTLSTLSQNPVQIEPFNPADGTWHSHIDLGSWADVFVIAPLTANTLAKMASGICDNLLTAVYLAARCPVFFAPAMDVDMFEHPTTETNIQKLVSFGNILIAPAKGELASGLSGFGRMEEPENIIDILENYFSKKGQFTGKKILITSGPTIEPIDPVRFISNFSSGKMGNALAEEAAIRGAQVTLISGQVCIKPVNPAIKIIQVKTADDMLKACQAEFPDADVTLMAAAVADYTPADPKNTKIKKEGEELTIRLKKTTDILTSLGARKGKTQVLAGFALETENEISNAISKMHNKNLDFIVLNSLRDEGAGFASDTNKITLINSTEDQTAYTLKSKKEVAADIFDYIQKNYFQE
jgi:phosphopantothenoylcysteine decarboxylase / phosphopantothenate---cysteine ligase